MSDKLKKLLNKKAILKKDCDDINAKSAAEGRETLSDEEQKQFDANLSEAAELDVEIKRQERLAELAKTMAAVVDPNVEAQKKAAEESEKTGKLQVDKIEMSRLPTPRNFKGEPAVAKEKAYRAGRWFLAHVHDDRESLAWCERNGVLAMQSTVDTKGGILVPEEVGEAIDALRLSYGLIRREARQESMKSDAKTIPKFLDLVTVGFVNENQDSPETEPKTGALKLVAKELAALVRWPKSLDEDTPVDLADKLTDLMARAMAKKEDECGFLGDGSPTYGGIKGIIPTLQDGQHAASLVVMANGLQAFSDITMGHFESMMGLLPEYAHDGAKWYISNAGWAASMQRLINASGGTSGAEISAGVGPTFQAYPVVRTPVLPKVLTDQVSTVLALFGNLKQAVAYGNRREIVTEVDGSVYFKQRQLAIQSTERFDIVCDEVGDATNAGSVIALVSAAS